MASGNKKLTVSYGTFSCTLEGFDDAFETMRAITEYFRDLSAQDRYFGATPPVPDTQMLEAIAEREIRRRVEARVSDTGVVLRAREDGGRGERAQPAPAPKPAPAEGAAGESVAARLARIRAMAARSRQAEDTQTRSIFADDDVADLPVQRPAAKPEAKPAAAPAPPSQPEPEPEPLPEVAAWQAGWDDFGATDAGRGTAETEAGEAAPEPEAEAAGEAPEGRGAPEAPAAPAAPARAEPEARAELEAPAAPEAEPESRAEPEAPARPSPAAHAPAEPETPAPPDLDTSADVSEPEPRDQGRPAPGAEAGREGPAPEAMPKAEPRPAAAPAPLKLETPAEPAAAPRPPEAPAPTPEGQAAPGTAPAAETPAPEAPRPRPTSEPLRLTDPKFATAGKRGSVEDQLRSFIGRLRTAHDAVTEAKAAPEAAAPAGPTPPAERAEAPPETPATAAGKPGREGRAILESGSGAASPDDDDVERLMESAQSRLEVADSKRRLAAISHMKAAVAATKADQALSGGAGDDEEDTELDRYRDDLSRVVQPRRPQAPAGQPEGEQAAKVSSAPLVLMTAQRIDRTRETRVGPAPREAGGTTGAMPAPQPEPAEEEAPATRTPSLTFPAFAERAGARNLGELMEAAAVYLNVHEGREAFSRPQIMRKVGLVRPEDDYPREEGLRAFGTLLRQGRIQKLRRGQFTIPKSSRGTIRPSDTAN